MADPVIPGGIRTQVVFPGVSGLPEDRYVTTWAFRRLEITSDFEDASLEVGGKLAQFYDAPVAPNTRSVASYMSNEILWDQIELRHYDLSGQPPREPLIQTFSLTPPPQGQPLPEEVAVCLSFFAGTNSPRRRGRVYIGPLLGGSTIAVESDTGRPVPVVGLRQAMVAAAERLRTQFNGEDTSWCVLSQADQTMRDVTAGWVDDAFDTQRRRGRAPVSRLTWSVSLP